MIGSHWGIGPMEEKAPRRIFRTESLAMAPRSPLRDLEPRTFRIPKEEQK